MSDTAKQSPLGVNALGSLLMGIGLHKNPVAVGFMGESFGYEPTAGYSLGGAYSLGSLCNNTVLRMVTYSINAAYIGNRSLGTVNNPTYNNIINIGQGVIPSFGNAKPPTFDWNQPSGYYGVGNFWAPTGWGGADQYTRTTATNNPQPVTAWGFVRLLSLQAWNEFNYNNTLPEYRDFLQSWMATSGFIDQTNVGILASDNSKTWLDGVYSNMNDLTSADVSGVSLSHVLWGQDLIKLGNAIDLSTLESFGLPSNLLRTLKANNAITDALVLAILASGITTYDLDLLLENPTSATIDQEKSLYAAYTIIIGNDLGEMLIPLNCKTGGLNSLADLLNPVKLFPSSYRTLTVPIYNTAPGPTNSKTYYFIYNNNGSTNIQLSSPTVTAKVEPVTRDGAPQPIITQPAPVELTSALKTVAQSAGITTSDIGTPALTPSTPVTSAAESVALAVIPSIPKIEKVPQADAIASGQASGAYRPTKPYFLDEK